MDADAKSKRSEEIRIACLCLIWFTVSSSNNIVGKKILTRWPHPLALTLIQLCCIFVYLRPTLYLLGIDRVFISRKLFFLYVLPLSFGKFIALCTSHLSLVKVSISYAHTVKSLMPIFVVCLTRLVLKERHSLQIWVSLLPIVGGVIICSVTEIQFDIWGLLSALFSTLIFSLLNIFSKQLIQLSRISPLHLLSLLSQYSLLLFAPFFLYYRINQFEHNRTGDEFSSLTKETILLLIVDGALCYAQNMIAFLLMGKLTSLSYSIASVTKRVSVICLSILTLGNPVTPMNVFGICMSFGGLFVYNRIKEIESQRQKKQGLLPLYSSLNSNASHY